MKKAIAYIRTATDMQNDDCMAAIPIQANMNCSPEVLEDQLAECQRLAENHGYTIVKTFEDLGVSGITNERPGLTDMIAFQKVERIEAVVAADFSRLSRDAENLLFIIKALYPALIITVETSTTLLAPTEVT